MAQPMSSGSTPFLAGDTENLAAYLARMNIAARRAGISNPRSAKPAKPPFFDFDPSVSDVQWKDYWHRQEMAGRQDPDHAKYIANVDEAMKTPMFTPEQVKQLIGPVAEKMDIKQSLTPEQMLRLLSGPFMISHGPDAYEMSIQKTMDAIKGNPWQTSEDMDEIVQAQKRFLLDAMKAVSPGGEIAEYAAIPDEQYQSNLSEFGADGKFRMAPQTEAAFRAQRAYDILRATSDDPDHRPAYADRSAFPLTMLAAGFDTNRTSDSPQGDTPLYRTATTPLWEAVAGKSGPQERFAVANYWADRGRPEQHGGFYKTTEGGANFPDWSVTNWTGLEKVMGGDEAHAFAGIMSPDNRYFGSGKSGNDLRALNEILGRGNRGQPVLPPGVDPSASTEFRQIVRRAQYDQQQNAERLGAYWPKVQEFFNSKGMQLAGEGLASHVAPGRTLKQPSEPDWSYAPAGVTTAEQIGRGMTTPIGLAGTLGTVGAGMLATGGKGMFGMLKSAAKAQPANFLDEVREEKGLEYALGDQSPVEMIRALVAPQKTNAFMENVEPKSPSDMQQDWNEAEQTYKDRWEATMQRYKALPRK